jgi:NADH-quinone oxidoreductase subunit L
LAVGVLALPEFVSHWQPFREWLAPVFKDLVREAATPESSAHETHIALRAIGLYTGIVAFFGWLTWSWFSRPNDKPNEVAGSLSLVHKVLWNKWYVDELYDLVFVRGFLGLSRWLLKVVDQGLIDGAVNLCGRAAQAAGDWARVRLNNGYARFYAASLLAGVVLLLALVLRYSGATPPSVP